MKSEIFGYMTMVINELANLKGTVHIVSEDSIEIHYLGVGGNWIRIRPADLVAMIATKRSLVECEEKAITQNLDNVCDKLNEMQQIQDDKAKAKEELKKV